MADRQSVLLANNRFKVLINKKSFSFSKITNISGKAEFEEYQEGGVNGQVRLFRKPKESSGSIQMEQGVCSNTSTDVTAMFAPGSAVKDIYILVMQSGSVAKAYYIEQGIVEQWEVTELDALGSKVMIKKVSIRHMGLSEIKYP